MFAQKDKLSVKIVDNYQWSNILETEMNIRAADMDAGKWTLRFKILFILSGLKAEKWMTNKHPK